MDTIQQQAYDCVVDSDVCGIFVTGSGGTGKSFLIKQLKKHYDNRALDVGKSVCFISSTTHLSAAEIGGHTINSITGLGLISDKSFEQISEFAKKPWIQNKWRDIECLILDEVSMLHGESFAKVVYFLQLVTTLPVNGKMSKYMSAIVANETKQYSNASYKNKSTKSKQFKNFNTNPRPQFKLVVFGDFLQIPPVVKNNADKAHRFAFEHPIWNQVIRKTFYLQKNFRQDLSLTSSSTLSSLTTTSEASSAASSSLTTMPSTIRDDSKTHEQTKMQNVTQDRFRQMISNIRLGQQTEEDIALLQQRNGALLELTPVNVMSLVERVREFNETKLNENPSKFVFVYRALTGYSKCVNKAMSSETLFKKRSHQQSKQKSTKSKSTKRAAEQKKLIKSLQADHADTVSNTLDSIFTDRDYSFPNEGTKQVWRARASKINEISRMEPVLSLKLGIEVLLIENLSMNPQDGLYNGARGIVVGFSRGGSDEEYTTDAQLADAFRLTSPPSTDIRIDCNLNDPHCFFPIVKFYKRTATLLAKQAVQKEDVPTIAEPVVANKKETNSMPAAGANGPESAHDKKDDDDPEDDALESIPGLVDMRPLVKEDPIDFLIPSGHNNLWSIPHEPFADMPDSKFHELSVKLKMPKMFFSQLPLLLGYAITAHRVQSMTLESLRADCRNLFEDGMFYVIASRVRKYQDLSFENFSADCIKTSAEAVAYYKALDSEQKQKITSTRKTNENIDNANARNARTNSAPTTTTANNANTVNGGSNLSNFLNMSSMSSSDTASRIANYTSSTQDFPKRKRESTDLDSGSCKKSKIDALSSFIRL